MVLVPFSFPCLFCCALQAIDVSGVSAVPSLLLTTCSFFCFYRCSDYIFLLHTSLLCTWVTYALSQVTSCFSFFHNWLSWKGISRARENFSTIFFSKSLFKSFLSRSPTAPIKSLLKTFISFPKPSCCLSFPKCHKGDFKKIERLFYKIFPSIHLLFS